MECACCNTVKALSDFKCTRAGNTKPSHVCTACYLEATMSLDMIFLERYKQVATRVTTMSQQRMCPRCEEVLPVSQFSVDKKRKDSIAVICKHCNREGIEKSRVKKRAWQEEDKYYEMPGGYGAPFKKRLAALYARESPNDERVKEGLVEGYVRLGLSPHEASVRVGTLIA